MQISLNKWGLYYDAIYIRSCIFISCLITISLSIVICLLLQISGIIIWPVLNMNWKDASDVDGKTSWVLEDSWALPVGLLLTSFGWWESFVDETLSSKRNFLWRVKINMIEEGSRYTTYLLISIWKIALFFGLFLLLSTTVVRKLFLFFFWARIA